MSVAVVVHELTLNRKKERRASSAYKTKRSRRLSLLDAAAAFIGGLGRACCLLSFDLSHASLQLVPDFRGNVFASVRVLLGPAISSRSHAWNALRVDADDAAARRPVPPQVPMCGQFRGRKKGATGDASSSARSGLVLASVQKEVLEISSGVIVSTGPAQGAAKAERLSVLAPPREDLLLNGEFVLRGVDQKQAAVNGVEFVAGCLVVHSAALEHGVKVRPGFILHQGRRRVHEAPPGVAVKYGKSGVPDAA
mmetsp:Transcript_17021/g.42170  ORF Transcript_17021/g.42170 Transcript_17021/m.42170 type:complete len:252 (-) Transcript_17021:503-1258(-)|eukprot:CAMPEP_0178993292 /NCGR_PEP_ID=MMETSP0795-20121207/6624_1 /TAXON_ID=88552 /ORGANISM="Amoebophrya sp., Strain Ameob2" /LENGTH=251 /DNA_ID=CAMNT_0020685339 /DNA_START=493 /DNA_END=1248 /DNA_ORIENTATION=-